MDPFSVSQSTDWMQIFLVRRQRLIDCLINTPTERLFPDVQALLSDIPESLSASERLWLRIVSAEVLFESMRHACIEHHPIVADSITRWLSRDEPTEGAWLRCTRDCWAVLSRPNSGREQTSEAARITLIEQYIATRAADPTLRVQEVAARFDVSSWHVARLLRQHAREGFRARLHGVRVANAERLLRETTLRVKEVAAAVGYNTTTQLERHFKHRYGETPKAFRNRMLRLEVTARQEHERDDAHRHG